MGSAFLGGIVNIRLIFSSALGLVLGLALVDGCGRLHAQDGLPDPTGHWEGALQGLFGDGVLKVDIQKMAAGRNW